MTLFPIALGVAFLAFWMSTVHLGTSMMAFYDFVALAMVVGGTIAVAMVVLPWGERKEVVRALKTLFVGAPDYRKQTLSNGLAFIQNRQSGTEWSNLPATTLANTLMNEGWELLTLGIQKDKLERILHERVYQSGKRSRKLANAVRSLAKYPPAFGLAGTVLGLMELMKGISEGLNAKETGVQMAVALVATFYGLMVSNLLVNPAGEALLKTAIAEEEAADLAVQAIVLASESSSLLEAQEILNSFVSDEQKIDMIGSFSNEESGEAA